MSFVVQQLTDPSMLLCAWVLIGVVAGELLVAIWAAVGPQHWFWRGLGLWGAVMLMAPLGAWQVMWVLVFAAGFIVGVVQLARAIERYRRRRFAAEDGSAGTRYRYSLRDLLLLVFLICLWLPGLAAAGREASGANWLGLMAAAAVWAGLAVLAAKLVFGPRRKRAAVLLAVALPLGAIAITRTLSPGDYWLFIAVGGDAVENAVCLAIVGLELILTLVTVMGLVRAAGCATASPTGRRSAGIALAAVASLAAAGLGYVYWELLQKPPRVAKFELAGNQYPRILEIANQMFVANPKNFPVSAWRAAGGGAQLADYLSALFDELLPLLAADNAVPYNPATDATPDYFGPNVQAMRGLCRALQAESEAALTKGQRWEAGNYALACVELSQAMGRGGLAVDELVSRAVESVGYAQIAKIRGDLAVDQVREALAIVARNSERHDEIGVLRAREIDFDERVRGFPARLEDTLLKISGRKRPWEQTLLETTRRLRALDALLRVQLSVQLFTAERGRRPATFEELVPDYLPWLPLDPYTDRAMISKTEDGKLILYSVGRDGVDDGGRFTIPAKYHSQEGYDLDLDTLTR